MSQETAARAALTIEPLTREAFAPFGDVIELEGAKQFPTNQGTTTRFHDLANVDAGEGGRALISLLRGQPRTLPFEVKALRRYPRGSQAFVPQNDKPYLVVAVPAGELDPSKLRASVSRGWQGINYARNVWCHPLLALGGVNDFLVVDHDGEGHNCDEQDLVESVWLTVEAMQAALQILFHRYLY